MVDADIKEKVDLFLSASDLPKVTAITHSEPSTFAVLYAKDIRTGNFVKFNRTDTVKHSTDPVWIKAVTVDYLFEVIQEIIIRVFIKDGKNSLDDESKHTYLGECKIFLASLMCTNSQKMTIPLQGGKTTGGALTIRGEVQANTRDIFCSTFSGHKLSNKEGFFATSDPFLVISRVNEDGTWTQVWKSETINSTLNPCWAPCRIAMTLLCNGDLDRPLRIEIFDFEKSGKHVFMGQVETSVRMMVEQNGIAMLVIEPEKKSKKKGYTNSGTLTAANVLVERHPTFADFITGGCEISMVVAIDFTASNGHPSDPASLHHISPGGAMNPYQQAIAALGEVLQAYDTNNLYPVYGFGAKVVQPNGQLSVVQHCFPVYKGSVEVKGVSGILQAYSDCMSTVHLSGPTLFAPLLAAAAAVAANSNCSQSSQHYTVLLVLTDGEINDLEATKLALTAAAKQPLSIIIVGVGNADFSSMKELDHMIATLPNGRRRDIVQFVGFNEYASRGASILAAKVLSQIPGQLLQHMAINNITPNKPKV